MKIRYLLFLGVIFLSACQSPQQEPAPSDAEATVGLLQHNVYFYLNEDVTEDQIADFEAGLEKLMSIEEIHSYQLGVPGSTEEREVTDHSFGYSIFSWFKTMEDYEIYAEHPTHLEFIDEYSSLWADVKVYDSEVISASE
ncbi:MAG: hypothetical protein CL670_03140 [Balneola sp.]|nr:hypothetical protein [Balneola sp.]MBE78128.1 hypothetical protein [Balneola sp.]